jgi:hypothetical protein
MTTKTKAAAKAAIVAEQRKALSKATRIGARPTDSNIASDAWERLKKPTPSYR